MRPNVRMASLARKSVAWEHGKAFGKCLAGFCEKG
jgi:hypothetical protein